MTTHQTNLVVRPETIQSGDGGVREAVSEEGDTGHLTTEGSFNRCTGARSNIAFVKRLRGGWVKYLHGVSGFLFLCCHGDTDDYDAVSSVST